METSCALEEINTGSLDSEPLLLLTGFGATCSLLTSSGFPRAAAAQELSLTTKSSGKELAGKLLWKSMKGILTTAGVTSADKAVLRRGRRPVTRKQTSLFRLYLSKYVRCVTAIQAANV